MLQPLKTAIQAAIIFIGHLLVGAVIAGCFKLFELWWSFLFGTDEPMIANLVPLRRVLEVGELAVIVAFLIFGFLEAVQVFWHHWRRRGGNGQ